MTTGWIDGTKKPERLRHIYIGSFTTTAPQPFRIPTKHSLESEYTAPDGWTDAEEILGVGGTDGELSGKYPTGHTVMAMKTCGSASDGPRYCNGSW